MRGFRASFRGELFDIVRHPLAWAGAAAVAVAAYTLGRYAPYSDNGYTVYESALQAGAKTASFFLLGIAAVAVAGERTRGTVRWILPRPVTRVGFVLGKSAAHTVLAVGFLTVAVGVSWCVAQGHGFGDVIAEAESVEDDDEGFQYVEEATVQPGFEAATMRRRTMIATLLVLPALLTATGIGLLVSSVLGSAAGAVIASIAVALPLNYLPEVVGLSAETARFLPFRAASDFLDQLLEFGRHLATADWPDYGVSGLAGALTAALGLPLLAALLFTRLDLTD